MMEDKPYTCDCTVPSIKKKLRAKWQFLQNGFIIKSQSHSKQLSDLAAGQKTFCLSKGQLLLNILKLQLPQNTESCVSGSLVHREKNSYRSSENETNSVLRQ